MDRFYFEIGILLVDRQKSCGFPIFHCFFFVILFIFISFYLFLWFRSEAINYIKRFKCDFLCHMSLYSHLNTKQTHTCIILLRLAFPFFTHLPNIFPSRFHASLLKWESQWKFFFPSIFSPIYNLLP